MNGFEARLPDYERPQGSVLYEGCERRRKGLGAAALRDHAEGSSVLFGQCDIDLADPLLDVEGKSLTPLRVDERFEPKSIQILHAPPYHAGASSLDPPLLTAFLTAPNNRS